MSVKFFEGAHWYDWQGESPQSDHDATLREARKKLLYASYTTVDKSEFKNEFLEKWKINQILNAAAISPRMPHETDAGYCQRIYDLGMEKATTAAAFGKEVHKAVEDYPQYPLDEKLHPWLDAFGSFYNEHIEHALHRETILLDHDIGLAGTCDFIGKSKKYKCVVIPDWKTQDVKVSDKGKKTPVFYDSWARQLSGYAVAYAKREGMFPNIPLCMSVVIDSNEACEPFVKVWDHAEIISAYEDLAIAAYRFYKSRNFWPHKNGKPSLSYSFPLPI